MTRLDATNLPALRAVLPVPGYDRSRLTPGIVHLGVGGFHRSHQAVYLDRLLERGGPPEWAVCGVGVLPGDAAMRDVLAAQDGLYTLLTKHPDGRVDTQVIGSIVGYLLAPEDPDAVVERMAAPSTRIVSLTVTEGGYNISPVTHEFDPDEPSIVADLAPGAVPRTSFALVTEALARRRQRGLPPFTVLSCDNVPGNGEVARASFGAFAALRDRGLGDWVSAEVPFPNSMVDRITPVTTDEDRADLQARFGVADAWPVVCEPFSQWVLEDRFSCGRPALEEVGVQVVADVAPYELMKLRLLNAGHQVLAHLGRLAGVELVHEACADPALRRFLLGYLDEEATPTLSPVPGIDLGRYKAELVTRFASPAVRDTLDRLATDASDRIPKFLLPVIRANLARGGPLRRSAAVLAAWALSCEGADEHGRPLELVDPRGETLRANARRQRQDPLAFVADRDLFGDLVDHEPFAAAYRTALVAFRRHGVRATLAQWALDREGAGLAG